jgi:hypothetical protein
VVLTLEGNFLSQELAEIGVQAEMASFFPALISLFLTETIWYLHRYLLVAKFPINMARQEDQLT